MSALILTCYRGESLSRTITATKGGVAQDITGAAIEFQVKAEVGASDPPLISKSVGSGITILNQTTNKGQFRLDLQSADTTGVTTPAGTYRYDIAMTIGGARSYVVPPSPFVLREVVNQA